MVQQRIRVEGARELDRVLTQLPRRIGKNVLRAGLRAGAREIKEEAERTAPRRTGTLAESIIVRTAPKREVGETVSVRVGPARHAFWGLFQEFGTRHHAPRPWLRPAFDTSAARAVDKVGEALGRNIERAARRLAGPLSKSGLVRRRR